MPKLPEKVLLNLDTQKVFIDGEEFPWHIVEDSIDVAGLMSKTEIPMLTVSIFADTIEVIPKRPTRSLECQVPDGVDPDVQFSETFPDAELVGLPRSFRRGDKVWVRCDVLDTRTSETTTK